MSGTPLVFLEAEVYLALIFIATVWVFLFFFFNLSCSPHAQNHIPSPSLGPTGLMQPFVLPSLSHFPLRVV